MKLIIFTATVISNSGQKEPPPTESSALPPSAVFSVATIMPSNTNSARSKTAPAIDPRLAALKSVIKDEGVKTKLETAFATSEGKLCCRVAAALQQEGVSSVEINKINFAHSLAEATGDNESVMKTIVALPQVNNMREFALTHGKPEIAKLVNEKDIPDEITGATVDDRKLNYAAAIHNKVVFATETLPAVLQRMVNNAELPIKDANVRSGVATFFDKNPGFNIRTTSVLTAIKTPGTFNGIPEEQHESVISQLKTLQRVQAISPSPGSKSSPCWMQI